MHPESDALLDAIFEHPDDDTPRLVYADWLQEHDQEAYAQFIRLQCAAAREKPWSAEANRLWEEIGRVWTRLDEEWWPATRGHWEPSGWLDAIHFHRGFLRPDVEITGEELVRYAEVGPRFITPETTLELTSSSPLKLLATLPILSRVCRIRYLGSTSGALGVFLCSSHLRCVRELQITDLTPSSATALVLAPNLASVTDLSVSFYSPLWEPALPDKLLSVQKAIGQIKERFPRAVCHPD